jgi:hypothetical protein
LCIFPVLIVEITKLQQPNSRTTSQVRAISHFPECLQNYHSCWQFCSILHSYLRDKRVFKVLAILPGCKRRHVYGDSRPWTESARSQSSGALHICTDHRHPCRPCWQDCASGQGRSRRNQQPEPTHLPASRSTAAISSMREQPLKACFITSSSASCAARSRTAPTPQARLHGRIGRRQLTEIRARAKPGGAQYSWWVWLSLVSVRGDFHCLNAQTAKRPLWCSPLVRTLWLPEAAADLRPAFYLPAACHLPDLGIQTSASPLELLLSGAQFLNCCYWIRAQRRDSRLLARISHRLTAGRLSAWSMAMQHKSLELISSHDFWRRQTIKRAYGWRVAEHNLCLHHQLALHPCDISGSGTATTPQVTIRQCQLIPTTHRYS